MKPTPILPLAIAALTPALFNACSSNSPYPQWGGANGAGAAPSSNPYGVPQVGGEVGTYAPAASSEAAPYQPLPGVNQPETAPAAAVPGAAIAGGSTHTVVSGDTLWGISRKYGTTIEAIQAANGLSNTTIQTGQQLAIPGR